MSITSLIKGHKTLKISGSTPEQGDFSLWARSDDGLWGSYMRIKGEYMIDGMFVPKELWLEKKVNALMINDFNIHLPKLATLEDILSDFI